MSNSLTLTAVHKLPSHLPLMNTDPSWYTFQPGDPGPEKALQLALLLDQYASSSDLSSFNREDLPQTMRVLRSARHLEAPIDA